VNNCERKQYVYCTGHQQSSGNLHGLASEDLFSSLQYNIRVGSGLATVQSAREAVMPPSAAEESQHESTEVPAEATSTEGASEATSQQEDNGEFIFLWQVFWKTTTQQAPSPLHLLVLLPSDANFETTTSEVSVEEPSLPLFPKPVPALKAPPTTKIDSNDDIETDVDLDGDNEITTTMTATTTDATTEREDTTTTTEIDHEENSCETDK